LFRITIDQGGTFADGVLVDDEQQISVAKASTNPEDPADSIMNTITLLAKERNMAEPELLGQTTAISLGTTLGTNAILEEKGARCCLIHT
jgi:N-methylhydantoinase A/oxoprolinase/acetone carboxylase beta subunit